MKTVVRILPLIIAGFIATVALVWGGYGVATLIGIVQVLGARALILPDAPDILFPIVGWLSIVGSLALLVGCRRILVLWMHEGQASRSAIDRAVQD